MTAETTRCRACDAPAHCIGFYYPENRPADVDASENVTFCVTHCDHDCCKLVAHGAVVTYPMFELVGPRCPVEGCDGILVNHMGLRGESRLFMRCSVCGHERDGWASHSV